MDSKEEKREVMRYAVARGVVNHGPQRVATGKAACDTEIAALTGMAVRVCTAPEKSNRSRSAAMVLRGARRPHRRRSFRNRLWPSGSNLDGSHQSIPDGLGRIKQTLRMNRGKEYIGMRSRFLVMAVVAAVLLAGCSRPDRTEETLELAGYSEIDVGGWAPFRAGKDDVWATHFVATGPSGERVRGVVSGGVFKGATIRILGRE